MAEHLGLGFPAVTRFVAAVGGGSWQADYPLSQAVQYPPTIGEPAISTDADPGSSQGYVIFDTDRVVRMVALVNHNLGPYATWRLRFYADAEMEAELYDSGDLPVWEEIVPFGEPAWGEPGVWDGLPGPEERAAYIPTTFHVAPSAQAIRAVDFQLNDPDNPDGALRFAHLELSDWWQPSVNFQYDLEVGFEDNTKTSQAEGGARYSDFDPLARTVQFDLDYLEEAEAFAKALELKRQHATARPVFLCLAPDDPVNRQRLSFLARLTALDGQRWTAFQTHSTRFSFVEEQ